jgi:ribosomal protein L30/L7E
MDQRRRDLGMAWSRIAADAGITVETLRALRRGANEPSNLTKSGIERALQWGRGSVDKVLAGGEPTLSRTPEESIRSLQERTQSLRETLELLRLRIKQSVGEVVDEEDDPQQLERMLRVIDAFRDAG